MAISDNQADDSRRTALITGASSGIGKAFAEVFARHGFNIVLVARRGEQLNGIACDLQTRYPIIAITLPADLSDPRAPEYIYERLQQKNIHIDALVNSAGYSLPKAFTDEEWKTHDMFLHVMITSAVHLCHLFIPGMKARGYGRIINVSSFVAFMAGTAGDLYVGAKSFLVKFSQSLDLELSGSGIHVTAVCPGFTRSEFHDVMGVRKDVDRLPTLFWMEAQTVAQQGYDAVMRGRPVFINGLLNKLIAFLMHSIPDSLQLYIGRIILKQSKK